MEQRARWVVETLGGHSLDGYEPSPAAWEQVDRGERPSGDELAEAFFHLARVEEQAGPRDDHGRFRAAASCLDLLDPPLERLRAGLGLEPPRYRGARFAVALTHDVDTPWRWTARGVRAGASRLKTAVRARRGGAALHEARGLVAVPVHLARRTDPNWSFDRILALEGAGEARSTFFVMAGHRHRADGASPARYDALRPRIVETIAASGGEIGLHSSYTAAADEAVLAEEKERLDRLAGPVTGHRYHYLRIDPQRNLAPLERAGFAYDSSLGYAGALGFRAGIAHPYRPWDLERDRPLDLVEIPLAVMDTSFEERYLGLSARAAEPRLLALLDWAAEHGGGFAVLWHTDRFDRWTAAGWDRLYERLLGGVRERDGICLTAGELAQNVTR
jgi:hypothetical protein